MTTPRASCPRCGAPVVILDAGPGQHITCTACGKKLVLSRSPKPVWYCARDRDEMRGPFTFEQLRLLSRSGELARTDRVWKKGLERWQRAGSVPGLFEPPAAPAPAPAPSPGIIHLASGGEPRAEGGGSEVDFLPDPDAEQHGPISLKGIKVRPGLTLTWNDFRIIRKVGAGSMGAVYLARQVSRNREVALKVLYQHLTRQPQLVDRFYREAETMSRLSHPAIVKCYGVGSERGCPYLAMELVRGFTTAAILRELGGRIPLGDALHVILSCARALRHAHEHHVVHRDFKPENVMIDGLGHVKITDLGLAKPLDLSRDLTETGVGIGTPRYMAPEQARDAKHVDHRCDIYAMGAVLYHFLTGQSPWDGATAIELMLAKERGDYARASRLNPEVPRRLDGILDRMMARRAEDRYPSCEQLIGDLESLELAREHLSFNVLQVCHVLQPGEDPAAQKGRVEVLLIHDSPEDIKLAQDALGQSGIYSNLSVVANGHEALAFLRRQDPYSYAPRPSLIILGLGLDRLDSQDILEELKNNTWLRTVPLTVLTSSPDTSRILLAHGLPVHMTVTHPDQLDQLEEMLRDVYETCVTVVEWPPRSQGHGHDHEGPQEGGWE